MFGQIARRYDWINTVLSGGVHHHWKRVLVRQAQVQPGENILDCATGTGDLALSFARYYPKAGRIIGTDFCAPMLEIARQRASEAGSKVIFEEADVQRLPYPTESFEVATISFGIRNVQDPACGIAELWRILRPGGRLLVLEFGQPRLRIWNAIYRFYSQKILPILGGWLSGCADAYVYLEKSSTAFPCDQRFLKLVQDAAPFRSSRVVRFFGGVTYLYLLHK